jgi:CPA2 family monovalent cation:H+ antiporter-2
MGRDVVVLASVGHDLVVLGAAFLVCAALARGGRHIGLPTIPLFMAAGIALGPNTPGPVLFEHPDELALLAAFGLVFLLFTLGLEFSVDDLTAGGSRLLITAGAYLAMNIGAGLALGFVLGWGTPEAFVIAGATGISSSAIVTKVLVELGRLGNPETRLILGIIVIEDLFLALYLAALAPVLGNADSLGESVLLFARSLGFLIVLGLVARYGGPIAEKLIRSRDDELLTISFFGFAVLIAGIAEVLGVSDAIGAFMAGLVLAGTTLARRVERLAIPIRDTFAAVFFFAFGLGIRPADLIELAGPVAVAVAMTVVLAIVAGVLAARLNHLDRQAAANVATTVMARGEFALILVALAVAADLDERMVPFVGGYVLVLAVLSPLLAAQSRHLARLLPRRLLPDPSTPVAEVSEEASDGHDAAPSRLGASEDVG